MPSTLPRLSAAGLAGGQELHTNQEALLTDFSEEGLSATVTFSSDDVGWGSMTTYLTRGMVRTCTPIAVANLVVILSQNFTISTYIHPPLPPPPR